MALRALQPTVKSVVFEVAGLAMLTDCVGTTWLLATDAGLVPLPLLAVTVNV